MLSARLKRLEGLAPESRQKKGGIRNGKDITIEFQYSNGKKVMLTVDEPRADLTAQSVDAAMQEIIASGVFEVDGAPLETAVGARVVERNVSELVTE